MGQRLGHSCICRCRAGGRAWSLEGPNEGGEFVAQLTETGPPPLCHWLLLLLVLRLAVGVVAGRPVGTRGSGIHKHTVQSHIQIQAWLHNHRDSVCAHAHMHISCISSQQISTDYHSPALHKDFFLENPDKMFEIIFCNITTHAKQCQ